MLENMAGTYTSFKQGCIFCNSLFVICEIDTVINRLTIETSEMVVFRGKIDYLLCILSDVQQLIFPNIFKPQRGEIQ